MGRVSSSRPLLVGFIIQAELDAKMLASALLFSALLNVTDTDVGEVDQDGWMFAALDSNVRCKIAQDSPFTEAEFDSKMPASSLFFAVLDSLFSAMTFFDVHQEVLIIEARLNAKMLASALLFSALHLCSRH